MELRSLNEFKKRGWTLLMSVETPKRSLISAITVEALFVQNSSSQHALFRRMNKLHIDYEGI